MLSLKIVSLARGKEVHGEWDSNMERKIQQSSQDTLLELLTKYNDIQNSDWGKKDVVIIVLVHRGTLLRFCSDKKVGFVLQNVYL